MRTLWDVISGKGFIYVRTRFWQYRADYRQVIETISFDRCAKDVFRAVSAFGGKTLYICFMVDGRCELRIIRDRTNRGVVALGGYVAKNKQGDLFAITGKELEHNYIKIGSRNYLVTKNCQLEVCSPISAKKGKAKK